MAPSSGEHIAPASSDAEIKKPPPEKPSDARRRTYVILSFWFIVVALGLPIWWQTTSIYRADLPLERMLQWANGKACRPEFPLQISIRADAVADNEAQNLVRLTQHTLDDLNDFPNHHLRLKLLPKGSKETAARGDNDAESVLTVNLTPGEANKASLREQSAVLDMAYAPNSIPSPNSASSALATYIANELRSTFSEEQTIISYLLSTSSMSASSAGRPGLSAETADYLAKRTSRSLRYAPTYHLSFSLFTDGAIPNTWDVDAAINEYMKPLLDVLGPIHNFTIDTQVQLYATPGVQSQALNKEHLASFINAAEWPLSPSIGGAPTLNFIVFVGNQTISSENELDGKNSQSWMIPQWGSVYLLHLPPTEEHVSTTALKQPMLMFGGHLLTLLGTPQSGTLPLRLSTLSRIRTTDLLLQAASSLGSLARLSPSMPSISIPRSVADGVSSSLQHLEQACANLSGPEGLLHARIAEQEAERAFFEKSMVGQLYFPDEHKIAVYLPLLGPTGVPLVLGLMNEIKSWIQRRKQRASEAKEKKSQ